MSDNDFIPIDVDWSNPAMEPGEREATVTKVESTRDGQPLRSKKGDLMLKLTFRLEPNGTLSDYLMLSGPGAPMGARKLIALGIEKGSKLIPNDLLGRRVKLDCKVEEFNGEPTLKASKYIALAGGSTPTPPTIDDVGSPW